ncbi:MAG: c-type cytochrome [Gemmataceae bacterium]|nr:c-type cytochrome [Gemmataceae bacterium]MCI0741687.1 c-type cytochrome [Gemmataceae bacterium]
MTRIHWIAVLFLIPISSAHAQREFGFDNTKPSGQPYLAPAESVKRMKVADGFEVKLFAAEPDVVNPIAMTVDEKGRVWVVESFEYPKRTPKGSMPRDRIKILEDTDGDGVCDKVSVFAEGKDFPFRFDLASGIEVGHGGVFLGAPPYLWFIENKNDKAGKFEVLLKGFGSHDTHETLNTFQWGPDGRLYGLHGVFTHSEVDGVKMNAAVWRYDVRSKKFDIFSEGTSNPWGLDWRNSDGEFILCCCVIPHLYHMTPGGIYRRQAGSSFNPYAYSYLNEICDHTFHKKSGWAHAGLIALDTPIMPKEYHDSVIFGSIHGCSIKRNVLKPKGSTFVASEAEDFLVSGDKNFRPINLRWGHNGEIYCIDWHDQNPCHQTKPDDWDYERGRVYRIQPKGLTTKQAPDLGIKSGKELIGLTLDANPWQARTALRLLQEGRQVGAVPRVTGDSPLNVLWLNRALEKGPNLATHAAGNASWRNRVAAIRLLAEQAKLADEDLAKLAKAAAKETSAPVRRELASLAIRHPARALIQTLLRHKEDAKDTVIPQLLWLAFEKNLKSAKAELDWLKDNAAGNALLTETIVPRTMRRLSATGKAADLEACLAFVAAVADAEVRRHALEGLAVAFKGRKVDLPPSWSKLYAVLLKSDDVQIVTLARRLAVSFQDRDAIARALVVAGDASAGVAQRLEAIRDLALAQPAEAQKPLRQLVLSNEKIEIRVEACRALAAYDSSETGTALLAAWKTLPPPVRAEAVSLLAGRKAGAQDLLAAVGKGVVARTDLTDNTILRIRAFKDDKLNQRIEKVWGKFRDSPKELAALINKMRGELHQGAGSFTRGKQVFENQCAKCHKFDGKGHEVGPNLDGAGRDIEYLLANILDPNRVVGQPYYTRIVELKSGRIETGLLHAEDEQTLTLKVENDVLKVIPRKEIEGKVLVQEKSVMPEGLANNMTVQDFRDLVRYVMAHPFVTDVAVASSPTPLSPKVLADSAVNWRKPVVGTPGRIMLPASKEKTYAYLRAEVTSPVAWKTKLLLGAAYPVTAILNGTTTYQGQPGAAPDTPDLAAVDVELTEGINVLLIQVHYASERDAVYVRFLDPDRRLRYGEK